MSRDLFLEEAVAIADDLAATAVHHRDRCNWSTREVPFKNQRQHGKETWPTVTTLNPSVYSGTAGMALFFARLSSFSDSRLHRATARAAMNHALRHASYTNNGLVGAIGSTWRFGFYLGTLGIAWTAHELARVLGEPHFERETRRIVRQLAGTLDQPYESDLMYGAASGLQPLLDLHARGVPEAGALASALGDRLVDAATAEGEAWSWAGLKQDPAQRNLTGLSHGTAGIAWGLTRLYAATKEEKYRIAALGAFQYEREHFDAEARNWPNFQVAPRPDGRYPCSVSWCHGAAGIGLGRAAAYPILRDARLLEEADIARQATERTLREQLDFPGRDFEYCHGVAGNAELLWLTEEGLSLPGALERARLVGKYGIERFGTPAKTQWGYDVAWPTAVTSGVYPPLITGLAGAAYFLLRLHDPAKVPTVLLPGLSTSAESSHNIRRHVGMIARNGG